MVIRIQPSDGHKIVIPIANGLICNSLSERLVVNELRKQGNIDIQPEHIGLLFKEIKNIRKNFGRLTIVDVESADGDRVKIDI